MQRFRYTGGTPEQGRGWGRVGGGAPASGLQSKRGSTTGRTMNMVNDKYWGSCLTHFK